MSPKMKSPGSGARTVEDFVEVAKALGHQGRLRILAMLRSGELCVCQITAVLALSGSTVSAHLADLRRAGLVAEEKRAKWVYYRLTDDEALRELVHDVLRLVAADAQLREDVRTLDGVRSVPVDELCRVGLNLAAVGVRPAGRDVRATERGRRHGD
jgi:DNA-binding transcriptional ArsR family regulator